MSATAEKTVRDLALESSSATRVFEQVGIDYCCGGDKSLEDACRNARLSVEEVQRALDEAQRDATLTASRDWQREPLRITFHPTGRDALSYDVVPGSAVLVEDSSDESESVPAKAQ